MEIEVESFKFPVLWQFHVDSAAPISVPPGNFNEAEAAKRPTLSVTKNNSKTVNILSRTFDQAYIKLREQLPHVRVREVKKHDLAIHYIVDDPRVAQTVERLEA